MVEQIVVLLRSLVRRGDYKFKNWEQFEKIKREFEVREDLRNELAKIKNLGK